MREQVIEPQTVEEQICMNDSVIQQLYGIGLKVQYCLDTLGEGPDQVGPGLEHVLGSLDSVIEELRRRIYQLQ
jgi:hypothetical protein